MRSRYLKTLLPGAVALAFALPVSADMPKYELYGEQGPASFQVTNDTYLAEEAGTMHARSQMGGVESEFSAFETVPREQMNAARLEREWARDTQGIFPEGPRILP